jgi:Ca-activated chloride channel family protein
MTTFTLPRLDDVTTSVPESGFGSLQCSVGNLPLASLSYDTQLLGLLCRNTITQTFYNPFDENIEATYLFPIEGEQAVTRCELLVEDRIVRAKLRERGQARADYAQAILRGHRAALLEENRPESFSMKVGNIPPGEAVRVRITTVGCLPLVQGEWTLRLPLVIAPRYTSGIELPRKPVGDGVARDTNAAPDASCVTPPTWLPGFTSPVDLKISCSVQLGTLATRADWPQRLASSLHAVMISAPTSSPGAIPQGCKIDIYPGEKVDRDFILRGKLEESQVLTSLEIESAIDEKASSVFAIQVIPPKLANRPPREVVFLLDRSGSMSGWKMEAATRGVGRLIDTLSGEDRFALFAFDDTVERFPVMNDSKARLWSDSSDKSRFEAIRWASKIESRGGTEMGGAMLHCLKLFQQPPSGQISMVPRSPSLVLVTDGQITAEDSILRLLGSIPEAFRPRIYCLGVDRAVNASVLQRITKFTGGTFELIESEKRLDEVIQRFATEMGAPALTNVEVNSGDLSPEAMRLAPQVQRTLYEGKVARFFGRMSSDRSQAVTIRGQLSTGEPWERKFEIRPSKISPQIEPVLLPLWGKALIREMEDAFVADGSQDQRLREEIIRTSIESNALSRFTAFVAIDETHRVPTTGAPHQLVQPVELPEGWAAAPPLRREWLVSLRERSATPQPVSYAIEPEAVAMLPEAVAREAVVMPLKIDDGTLTVLMTDPSDLDTLDKLRFILNMRVRAMAAARHVILDLINQYYAQMEGESADSMIQEFTDSMIGEFTDTQIDFCRSAPAIDEVDAPAFYDTAMGPAVMMGGSRADSDKSAEAFDLPGSVDDLEGEVPPHRTPPSAAPKRFLRMRRPSQPTALDNAPVERLVNQLLRETVLLKASHLIFEVAPEEIRSTLVINGAPQAHDKIAARLWESILLRLRTLAKMKPVSHAPYETGEINVVLAGKKHRLRLHFAEGSGGQSPSLLIEVLQASVGGGVQEPDAASACEPVREWFQRYASAPIT